MMSSAISWGTGELMMRSRISAATEIKDASLEKSMVSSFSKT